MEQLRATSTDVSNVTNQFLCLSNTQFLENRVYDDDEKEITPEERKEEVKVRAELCKLYTLLYYKLTMHGAAHLFFSCRNKLMASFSQGVNINTEQHKRDNRTQDF
jgi:hypothetical protein